MIKAIEFVAVPLLQPQPSKSMVIRASLISDALALLDEEHWDFSVLSSLLSQQRNRSKHKIASKYETASTVIITFLTVRDFHLYSDHLYYLCE